MNIRSLAFVGCVLVVLSACSNVPRGDVVIVDKTGSIQQKTPTGQKAQVPDRTLAESVILPSEVDVIASDAIDYGVVGEVYEVYQEAEESQLVDSLEEEKIAAELSRQPDIALNKQQSDYPQTSLSRINPNTKQVPSKGVAPQITIVLPAEEAKLDNSVKVLVQEANKHQNQGNLQRAASSLERAQRIAPREPYVLYQLAGLRLMQQDAASAEQIATRALGYSVNKKQMQFHLWRLISQCRLARGDHAGAVAAQEQSVLIN